MGHISKEGFIGYLNLIGLSREFRTNTNELVDATFHSQLAYLGIEGLRGRTRLEDIAQHERLLGSLSTIHEVKGDIERIDIRIIRVIDEHATTLSLFYFQSHGHRLKLGHTSGYLAGG